MSLRDDVRWVCDAADGLLVGWLPPRLPKWTTKEGEKLGWLVLLLWQKFYDASMARGRLEAEVARLKDDVDGLRETNERLTDLLERPEREAAVAALGTGLVSEPGHYWVKFAGEEPDVAHWDGTNWWICEAELPPSSDGEPNAVPLISGRIVPPGAT